MRITFDPFYLDTHQASFYVKEAANAIAKQNSKVLPKWLIGNGRYPGTSAMFNKQYVTIEHQDQSVTISSKSWTIQPTATMNTPNPPLVFLTPDKKPIGLPYLSNKHIYDFMDSLQDNPITHINWEVGFDKDSTRLTIYNIRVDIHYSTELEEFGISKDLIKKIFSFSFAKTML